MSQNALQKLDDSALLVELRNGQRTGVLAPKSFARLVRARLDDRSYGPIREAAVIEAAAELADGGHLKLSQDEDDELATQLVGWVGGYSSPSEKARFAYRRASAASLADAVATKTLYHSHQIATIFSEQVGIPDSEFASGKEDKALVRALAKEAAGEAAMGETRDLSQIRAAVKVVLAGRREKVLDRLGDFAAIPVILASHAKKVGGLAAEMSNENELLAAFERKTAAHRIALKVKEAGGSVWEPSQMGRALRDVMSRVDAAINGIETKIVEELMRLFDVELPTFDDWTKSGGLETAEWMAFQNDGGEHCDGVKEESSLEDHPFLIMPGWKHVHALGRLFDLDSVDHGFGDEYTRCGCGNCSIALRTSPNGHGWQPGYVDTENGTIDTDHLDEDDIEEVISGMVNDPRRALNNPAIDPSKLGFKKINSDLQTGWYDRTDDPEEVLKLARAETKGRGEFLFVIDGLGQFHVDFSLWARKVPPRLVAADTAEERDGVAADE